MSKELKELKELRAIIEEQSKIIAQQAQQIEWLQKMVFGPGKGEKTDSKQLELFKKNEINSETPENIIKLEITYEREQKKKPRLTREEKFSHLPEKEVHVSIPDEVKANPGDYKEIGEVKTFEVDMTPPIFFKKVFIRKKFKSTKDKTKPPLIAPARKQLIPGSYASINLITQVILDKYLYHMPLDRQEKKYARFGVDITRQTMCDWLGHTSWALEGLFNNIKAEILSRSYLQMDETPVSYKDGVEKKNHVEKGYLWLVNDPQGHVLYNWSTTRATQVIYDMLGDDWEGILQCDGYSAYNSYRDHNPNVKLACCLAHVCRKFYEAEKEQPLLCRWVLRLIGNLYQNETTWENLSAKERSAMRCSCSPMILNLLKRIAEVATQRSLPQNKLYKAGSYFIKNWEKLHTHLHDGNIMLDNNLIENAVRPSAVGKKNWLFIGHKDAGQRTAIFYTIIENCKRFGINPSDYLNNALNRIVNERPSEKLYQELLPSNWIHPNQNKMLTAA